MGKSCVAQINIRTNPERQVLQKNAQRKEVPDNVHCLLYGDCLRNHLSDLAGLKEARSQETFDRWTQWPELVQEAVICQREGTGKEQSVKH